MNRVLILYPELFKCSSKFDRKVKKVCSRMEAFKVVFPSDPIGLIADVFTNDTRSVSLKQDENWSEDSEITHAIVFGDDEEFTVEITLLENRDVNIRRIHVPITRVINISRETKYADLKSTPAYEYIGRGSYWGNPYSMFEAGESRDEVIQKYEYDFINDRFPNKKKSEVFKLTGKRLGCFCKPQACHGDVLADFLNSYDDGM